MNIGFDAKRAFNNLTGLGNYSRSLMQGLATQFPNHKYFLFTPSEKIELNEESKFQVIKPQHFLHKRIHWYWRSFYLPVEERNAGLDIYHGLSNELPFGKPPAGVKQVVTIHDLIFRKHPEFYPLLDRNIYEMKVRHSCRIADCIITVSEQTKRDLVEWCPLEEHKICVLYQSCSAQFETEIANAELHRIRLKHRLPDRFILYVGAISERKNLTTLVKSYHALSRETNAHLVIVGNGNKGTLETLVRALKLSERVHILPDVSDDELPAIYRSAHLFVYPSVYEGFGIPIIEALFSKVPVVTTKGGCFAEAGGLHSCYVDTQNTEAFSKAMLEVLTNQPLRDKMISAGTKHTQQFKTKIVSAKVMELYERLAANG